MIDIPFGKVAEPWWDDRPVLLVGTGLSLQGFDFNRLRGLGHVIAVKNSIDDLPFADACFGLDHVWPSRRKDFLTELAKRIPLYIATVEALPQPIIPGATYLVRARSVDDMSFDPKVIQAGGTSGFGALNLAVLKRAREIVLFGYDYTSNHYCHDRYPGQPTSHNSHYWPRWANCFHQVASTLSRRGVSVLNASPKSNLTAFTRVSIEQALEHLDRLRSERDAGVRRSEGIDQPPPAEPDPDLRNHAG